MTNDLTGKIRLEESDFGCYLIVNCDNKSKDILIQVDYDRCGTASSFGWSPCTGCAEGCDGSTDGTVGCKRRTVSEHIASATKFLDDNIGAEAGDPGYFS